MRIGKGERILALLFVHSLLLLSCSDTYASPAIPLWIILSFQDADDLIFV